MKEAQQNWAAPRARVKEANGRAKTSTVMVRMQRIFVTN